MKQEKLRCLLIDDRIAEHKIFESALEQTGVNVLCEYETDARKAFEKLLATPGEQLPAVIFLDLYMPGWDGKKFLKEIKQNVHLKNIPVYAYTSSSDSADVKELVQSGAVFYIMKTANIPGLSMSLKMLLENL